MRKLLRVGSNSLDTPLRFVAEGVRETNGAQAAESGKGGGVAGQGERGGTREIFGG